MSPGPARDSFVQAFPEIQRATHFFYSRESVLKDNMLFGEITTQADANFFDVFKLEFLEGSAASAITDSSSVAISGTELQGYLSGWLMSALCHKQILKMARKYRGTVSQKGIYP